jgi:ketosteroid isomerase-like protein
VNADLVRRALALTSDAREDIPDEELAELLAPGIVIDMSARVFNPHVYEGYGGLRQYRVDLRETWDEVAFHPEELIEEGDRVIAISRMRGYGRGSRVPIDEGGAAVYTVAGGRIHHVRFLGPVGRDEALAMLRAEAAASAHPPEAG